MAKEDLQHLIANTFLATAEHHAVLGSTNDRARELSTDPAVGLPALVMADQQTAGRGRRSNRWWTGQGALAFSLLLEPASLGILRQHSPQLSLVAAVAVVDTLRPLLPALEVGLHWPNDVFAAGRKLSGILVEALPDGRHILGIGINVNNALSQAPPEVQHVATTLFDLIGHECDSMALLTELLQTLASHLQQLAARPEEFGRRYDEHCLQRGQVLTIQHGQETTRGNCLGVATDGALMLETSAGRQAFYGGFLIHDRP
ncbi:MAG: biotin--[acetyl-CoA-carboxylase] ligase [Pirellulales bacterium]